MESGRLQLEGIRDVAGHNLFPQGSEGRPPEIIALPEAADLERELDRVLHRLVKEE